MTGLLSLLGPLSPIIDKALSFIPDPQAKARAEAEARSQLIDVLSKSDIGQLDVNRAEAQSGSLFVAGWRPAIGWVCAAALAYQYILRPVLLGLFDLFQLKHAPILMGLDDNLWQLMLGMLGMGGLRTFEKINKVATK